MISLVLGFFWVFVFCTVILNALVYMYDDESLRRREYRDQWNKTAPSGFLREVKGHTPMREKYGEMHQQMSE